MDKEERAQKACQWMEFLDQYEYEIKNAVSKTQQRFNPRLPADITRQHERTDIVVVASNSIESAYDYKDDGHVCILNFASYKNPGGGFLKGSIAQEEDLCHHSALYPILNKQSMWYKRHRYEQSTLYSTDYIYSREVPTFFNEEMFLADYLTMSAPRNVDEVDRTLYSYELMLRQEIAFIAPYVGNPEVDTLILGAWGCGVFANDPKKIATNWYRLCMKYAGLYKRVVHPIPDDKTLEVFNRVNVKFSNGGESE